MGFLRITHKNFTLDFILCLVEDIQTVWREPLVKILEQLQFVLFSQKEGSAKMSVNSFRCEHMID